MPDRLNWFPDWSGRTAVVAGCGPSLTRHGLQYAVERAPTIVVNNAWRYAPSADVLYAADWEWWAHSAPPDRMFGGLRVCGSRPSATQRSTLDLSQLFRCDWPELMRPTIAQSEPEPLKWRGEALANGGNGGLQAANLAARFGATRIVLMGIDAGNDRQHAEGLQSIYPGACAASADLRRTWRDAWAAAAKQFEARGIEVLNASPLTEVRCFPIATIESALIAG